VEIGRRWGIGSNEKDNIQSMKRKAPQGFFLKPLDFLCSLPNRCLSTCCRRPACRTCGRGGFSLTKHTERVLVRGSQRLYNRCTTGCNTAEEVFALSNECVQQMYKLSIPSYISGIHCYVRHIAPIKRQRIQAASLVKSILHQ
jgi:hypothetical protein